MVAQAQRAEITIERALRGRTERVHYQIVAEINGGPFAGHHTLILRGQADNRGSGFTSAQEFAIRRAAFGAGLTTPEPLWLEPDGTVLGSPFMILSHAAGMTDSAAVQAELSEESGDRLVYRLGQELARLHGIAVERAPAEIAFLSRSGADWAERRAERWRAALDGIAAPQPCFEWAINWFADHAPKVEHFALCHRDLRLGNFVVADGQLTGILDLDEVGWSDPMEDLGWLCGRGGRGGLPDREAGGIGSREALYDGYRDVAGREVDDRRVRFWEIAAALRQGIAVLESTARPGGDAEHGLAAAIGGLQSIEMEYDLLLEIERYEAEGA
ncbi:MAG: phosphotransferase family protein [Dongiaceae bacterium]